MSSENQPGVESGAPKKSFTNCRVFERQSCKIPTVCQPTSAEEEKWLGTISDISRSGVRLNLQRRFERNTSLAIELAGIEGHESSVVFVKVIHILRLENGDWSLGCRFISELSEDTLQGLVKAKDYELSSLKKEKREKPAD